LVVSRSLVVTLPAARKKVLFFLMGPLMLADIRWNAKVPLPLWDLPIAMNHRLADIAFFRQAMKLIVPPL